MKIFKFLLAIMFVAMLFGANTFAQTDDQNKNVESNAGNTTKSETSPMVTRKKGDPLNFPDVKDWRKTPVVKYPQPELGYSQNYDWPEGGRVSIYVYNGGRKDIRNSLSGAVAEEIERSKAEIYAIAEMGYYTEVKELTNETSNVGGAEGKLKALKKVFNYKQDGTLLYSELFVLPLEGNFLKIRATREADADNETKQAFDDLLKNLEDFLLKHMETVEAEKLAVIIK